ncbi:DUF262 domain-containing protein [Sphaerisporangium sp. NPDC088356]|uniref:DUF262 domain-containing protein n=1 Tax=Sphaerisporangium sp. NPDC088356 TaxID=3154871 RepID=UPI003437B80E
MNAVPDHDSEDQALHGIEWESLEVPMEYSSTHTSTGVEHESIDEISQPFDPERIDVITRNPTIDLLLSRIRDDMIDLAPDFQRAAGIWNLNNQSKLIESLLLRIPLPTFYAAENKNGVWVIVDGIQRLTTIASFIEPESLGRRPLTLQNLTYLGQYNGLRFEDLPGRLRTRLRETELVVHLIRPGTPEAVKFNIFTRINTGGLPLSRQELRHALIPGPARILLRELAESVPFRRATDQSIKSERMDDREMVLRFIAFLLIDDIAAYDHRDFDGFLRSAMSSINVLSPDKIDQIRTDFRRAMDASTNIFGQYAFRKRSRHNKRWRLPINKALFEAISVNLAKRSDEDLHVLTARRDRIQEGLSGLLLNDSQFERAISVGTGDPSKIRDRFAAVDKLVREVESA